MSKTLAVIDRLHFTGFGRLLRDLALQHKTMRVVTLQGPLGVWGEQLRQAGVEVEALNWRSALDVKPWRRLRALVKESPPDSIVAWGRSAARWAALSGKPALAVLHFPLERRGLKNSLDRWLMRRFVNVIALSDAERHRAIEGGWRPDQIRLIPPGIDVAADEPPATLPGVAATAPVVLCVADLVPEKGVYDAIWGIDVLRFVYPDVRLVVIGDGPERARLEQFAAQNSGPGVVHFLGEQGNLGSWYARASVVWCTSRGENGVDGVLTAMAHGRPVVAHDWPALSEAIVAGQTGHLIPRGDKVTLGKVTRPYIDNPAQVRQAGDAARQVIRERFSLGHWAFLGQ